MKLRRGTSGFWAFLYSAGMKRAHMPFWRVVVEGKLDRRLKKWPRKYDAAVIAVYVWARSSEEAEGLAALAVEEEGVTVWTADAVKCAPAAAPQRAPMAVARGEIGFIARLDGEKSADPPSRRDARA